ncbi:MAG: hypothetical protein IPM64_10150 [Phycisphaerales bacterium]|nr:hypothetical protein [Phycisphaerales bacterium]
MRSLMTCSALAAALLLAGGCAGVVKNEKQAWNTFGQTLDADMAQLGDDFNYLIQVDRPSRLTKWITR